MELLWKKIHVDFATIASLVDGVMYMIVVDAKSKWIEVLSMSSNTTAATVREFCYLFSLHATTSCVCFGIAIKKTILQKQKALFIDVKYKFCLRYVCMYVC